MAKVIIFGMSDLSVLAYFYFTHDSEHDVVAFTVNEKFLSQEVFEGLPVVPFENIQTKFPASDFHLFVAIPARGMNKNRERIYIEGQQKGYEFVSYISSKATVWEPDMIGNNCFIFEDNTVQPYTTIGNNVVLWSGNHIGHHSEIKSHVFFTSHVVLSGHCMVDNFCYFGVNSTIRDGLNIAKGTLVGMGANLISGTDSWGAYIGNPAKKMDKPSYEIY